MNMFFLFLFIFYFCNVGIFSKCCKKLQHIWRDTNCRGEDVQVQWNFLVQNRISLGSFQLFYLLVLPWFNIISC